MENEPRSLEEFEALIKQDVLNVKVGLLSAGRHLLQAKEQHPRSFVGWLNSGATGISRSSAYRLMEIAKSGLADFPSLGNFPSEVGALLELSRLAPTQLQKAIDSGDISPNLHQKDARILVARYLSDGSESSSERKPGKRDIGKDSRLPRGNGSAGPFGEGESSLTLEVDQFEAEVLLRCLSRLRSVEQQRHVLADENERDALLSVVSRLRHLLGSSAVRKRSA